MKRRPLLPQGSVANHRPNTLCPTDRYSLERLGRLGEPATVNRLQREVRPAEAPGRKRREACQCRQLEQILDTCPMQSQQQHKPQENIPTCPCRKCSFQFLSNQKEAALTFHFKKQAKTPTVLQYFYLILFKFFGLFMYMNILLHVCMCITCLPGACEGQKRVSDTLELEFQRVVGLHVGSGYKIRSSARAASGSLSHLSRPFFICFQLSRSIYFSLII